MDNDRDRYIRNEIEKITHSWVGISAIFGIVFFLALSVLDYFVTPENFNKFLVYRASISLILGLIFLANRLKRNLYYQYFLTILGILLSAATIELMILDFGGHRSLYYAGYILLIICVLGILPLHLIVSLVLSISLYLIYLIPILLYDRIVDHQAFINSNAFLISTIIVAFGWRILNQRSIIKELELQYELEQDKKQLAFYSANLEHLVEERTKQLNKSEMMLRSLFEQANDAILIMDEKGVIIDVNNRASDIYGFEKDALIGASFESLSSEKDREQWQKRLERLLEGQSLVFETKHLRKDGEEVNIEVSAKAIRLEDRTVIQAFCRDITEKKRLQQQLLQIQKMECVGELAGGVAHEFNNFLTVIVGYSDMLIQEGRLDERTLQLIRQINRSARQASQLANKLLSFARKTEIEKTRINLNDLINETHQMLARILPKNIEIQKQLHDDLPFVEADPNQIEQVLMNLVLNARDAMPQGGTLRIRTDRVTLKEVFDGLPHIKPGEYVVVSIEDTGKGIPEKALSRIFEPFFTTKEKGKGTGLGLSMVYGIVKEHGGYIDVKSSLNKGTKFDVYLPATTDNLQRMNPPHYFGR